VAFQQPPYTNALELEARLRPSLRRVRVHDRRHVRQRDAVWNRALDATYRPLGDGKYEAKLKVAARKLKGGRPGSGRQVAPGGLDRYRRVFDAKDKALYMERRKIDKAERSLQ